MHCNGADRYGVWVDIAGAVTHAFQGWGKADQGCDPIDVNEIIAYFQSGIERDARCRYGLAGEVPPES